MPVYLLNELVKQTPEGVYLTSVKQGGQQVAITGVAQTNERISEFLRNTASNSPWLEKPQLVEIQAQTMQVAGSRDQRRMFAFIMGVTLKRPPRTGRRRLRRRGVRLPARRPAAGTGFGRFDGDEVSMATQAKDRGADFLAAMRGGLGQFRDLNPNQPGQWPLLPRLAVWTVVAIVVVVVGWFVGLERAGRRPAGGARQGAGAQERVQDQAGPGHQPRRAQEAEGRSPDLRHAAREAAAGQGRDGRAADRHQPGRRRPWPGDRPVHPGPDRDQGVLRRAADRHPRHADASTTSAPSRPTSRRCRASSRCTTCRSAPIRSRPAAACRWKPLARTYRYLDPAEVVQARAASGAGKDKK